MPADRKNRRAPPAAAATEARLRALTDQALGMLDQLVAARLAQETAEEEGRALAQRLEALEGLLADARRRVRGSRAPRDVGRRARPDVVVDLVLWVPPARVAGGAALAASVGESVDAARGEGVACTVIVPPGVDATALAAIEGLTIVEADWHSPAHACNMAMSATDAPVVLIAVAGAAVDASGLEALAGSADESVAVGVPLLVHGDRATSLGLVETTSLAPRRNPGGGVQDGDLELAAPEAFAVHRDAHLVLGTFDEDLHGPAAVTEYCLRARDRGFAVRACPECKVRLPEALDLVDSTDDLERDRLIVIARHRRERLGAAMGAFELFWSLSDGELRNLLRAVLARLPERDRLDFLVTQLAAVIRGTVAPDVLGDRVTRLGDALHELHSIPFEEDSPRLAEINARLREVLGNTSQDGDLAARFESMLERLRLEVEAKVEFHAIAAGFHEEFLAALEGHDDLRRMLDEGKSEVEILIAQREMLRAQGEEATALRGEKARLEERVDDLAAQLAEAHEQIAAGDRAQRELIDEREAARRIVAQGLERAADTSFEGLGAVAAGLRVMLAERHRWIVALLEELQRKRFRIKPRKLAPHEAQFIAEHGPLRRGSS